MEAFSVGGFQATHKTIGKYLVWSAQDPEQHSELLSAQAAYVTCKNNDPDGRAGSNKLRAAVVTIENEEEDAISYEEMDFVTLTAWQDGRKEFKDPKTGKLPHPSDFMIEMKFRKTRKHPQGVWGVLERTGKAGHHKVHRRLASRVKRQRVLQDQDDAVLRDGQADDIFAGAAKDSLGKCDETALSVAEVLDLLGQSRRPDEEDEAEPQNNANADGDDIEEDSDLADEAADAALESEMTSILSSNRAVYGVHAQTCAKSKEQGWLEVVGFPG